MNGDRRILLLGKDGQLGHALAGALQGAGTVTAMGRDECNMADTDAVRRAVRAVQPAVIVNAAAYTAVDKAEEDEATAMAVNAVAPKVLAEEALALGAHLVHYSTDYVFDGAKDGAYTEEDATNPLSAYGRSKLAGERAIAAVGGRYSIFRTSWVFGAHGKNFAKTMLHLAAARPALRVIADQHGVPTSVDLLARVTLVAIDTPHAASGVYHVAPGGETTWHGYACYVIEQAQALGMPLLAMPDAVEAIATHEYPLPARRPANSRLDCGKVRRAFGVTLPPWQDDVRALVACMAKEPAV